MKLKPEKFGDLAIAPIKGVSRSLTNEETTELKAAPITIPVAKSTKLPFEIKFLNPSKIFAIISMYRNKHKRLINVNKNRS